MNNKRILHCAKRLVQLEALFNQEVDDLLDALELTREEVIKDGRHSEIVEHYPST